MFDKHDEGWCSDVALSSLITACFHAFSHAGREEVHRWRSVSISDQIISFPAVDKVFFIFFFLFYFIFIEHVCVGTADWKMCDELGASVPAHWSLPAHHSPVCSCSALTPEVTEGE